MVSAGQKVLRRFWHAVIPLDHLKSGPKPFRLLGENIVLFLDERGAPAALQNRCCHRTAQLSKGWCENGQIVCGYHGWTYNREGELTRIPQFDPETKLPKHRVKPYRRHARYGHPSVALAGPIR